MRKDTLPLDFLALDGTPDPRAPSPHAPEAQLPLNPQMPGARTSPEDINMGAPNFSGAPKNMGNPNPQVPNFPNPEIYDSEVLKAISLLAEYNIQTVMPGGLMPTPNLEQNPDFNDMKPQIQSFLRVLEKSGRISKAADISGVARGTIYRMRKQDPKFQKLFEAAIAHRKEILEDEAIRRAVEGVREDVYYMGAVCGTKRVYSDALLSKLLEGNMPEKYRQNHKVEVEGKVGVATLVLPATMSAEEWASHNAGTIIDQEPEDPHS